LQDAGPGKCVSYVNYFRKLYNNYQEKETHLYTTPFTQGNPIPTTVGSWLKPLVFFQGLFNKK